MAHATARHTVLVLLSLLLTITGTVMAQTTTAGLIGTVKDESGGVLPGVTLTIRSRDTGQTRTTVTDTSGEYAVRDLPPGEYEVEAVLSGFSTAVRTGIRLTVGRQALLDLDLKVGELSEKLIVTGDAPLVETASSTIRGLVDEKKIRDLPLNGRSFDQLALLQPGVVAFYGSPITAVAGVGVGQKFSVGGARPTSNNYLLDGTNINNSQGVPGSIAGVNLGVEAVQEFEILTSVYDATFGRNAGGVVNVISKSGSNTVHGSVFEFHRNDAFDARNFFDREEVPPFKRNQFGFSLGGPIKRDKAFLFGNYEGFRENLGLSNVAVVPTAAARQGILPTGPVAINPNVQPYLALYPLPNGRDFGDGTGEFLSSPSRPIDEDYYTTRYDQNVSNADSFFVRYTIDDAVKALPDPILVFPGENRSRSQYLTVEHKHIISSRMLNTARFGYNRATSITTTLDEGLKSVSPSLSFVPGQTFGLINFAANPSGVGSVVTNLGPPQSRPNAFSSFQYMDDFSYSNGRNALRVGMNIERAHHDQVLGVFQEGLYAFTSLRGFLLGQAVQFQGFLPPSRPDRAMRATQIGVYVQDDFRWRPNVTINLGLRYEGMTTPQEANGLQSRLVNLSDPETTVGLPYFDAPPPVIQPRVGVAWDLKGDGKTSLRAGFGIFSDTLVGTYLGGVVLQVTPFSRIGTVTNPNPSTFPAAFQLLAQGGGVPAVGVSIADPRMPTRSQFNVSVQRELMPQTVVMVAYTGSVGRHGIRNAEANTAIPTSVVDGVKFWAAGSPRRNPNFASILTATTDATSSYNSLQISANRRFRDGLQFQGSYTWGHSVDDGSVQFGIEARNTPQTTTDFENPEADRGDSAFDVRHYGSLNATYELPFGADRRFASQASGWANHLIGGWQLNAIFTAASGNPVTLLTSFNRSRNQDLRNPDRPNLVAGRSDNPVLGGPDLYFDPTAFELPPPGFQGNLGRGTLEGPGLIMLDAGVSKDVTVGGRTRVQVRAEVFNLLNRANFGFPSNNIFNPDGTIRGTAGRISNTVTTSRQVQFGLKVIF